MSCDPDLVQGVSLTSGTDEFLRINFEFPANIRLRTREYRLRLARADISPSLTVLNERDIRLETLPISRNSMQIRPPAYYSANYTAQICAVKQSNACNIDWTQENKYRLEFISRSFSRKDFPEESGSIIRPLIFNSATAINSCAVYCIFYILHFVLCYFDKI